METHSLNPNGKSPKKVTYRGPSGGLCRRSGATVRVLPLGQLPWTHALRTSKGLRQRPVGVRSPSASGPTGATVLRVLSFSGPSDSGVGDGVTFAVDFVQVDEKTLLVLLG